MHFPDASDIPDIPDIPDSIERIIDLSAPIDRVWKAISTPVGLNRWFGLSVDGEFKPGGLIIFRRSGIEHAHGRIVAIDPPVYFAFRWRSHSTGDRAAAGELPGTLVEFRLATIPEGTRLTLLESGFRGLPEELRARSIADNTQGWDEELDKLLRYITSN